MFTFLTVFIRVPQNLSQLNYAKVANLAWIFSLFRQVYLEFTVFNGLIIKQREFIANICLNILYISFYWFNFNHL